MDFRLPIYRREVFLRFYEFHLKYKLHPGAVYFAMPWLAKYFNMSKEQKLWTAFINGCSQNIVTTYMIFQKFPTIKDLDIDKLDSWWNDNHQKFKSGSGWDTDRKYFKIGKTGFPVCVKSYKDQVDKFGSQTALFDHLINTEDKYKNFEKTWDYEQLRKQYVEERRNNKDHKYYRPLWNGVSPGMWEDQDWYDYLKAHNMEDPYKKEAAASLEDFF
jgi:Alpha-glutamyl/putrescinyl thymine pyrophosphorylase clade 2